MGGQFEKQHKRRTQMFNTTWITIIFTLLKKYIFNSTVTRDMRATPTSDDQLWAWSQLARCCVSERRSGAGGDDRKAS